MNAIDLPATALIPTQLQRSFQMACFLCGWVERQHLLTMTAYANWWIGAAARSAPGQLMHSEGTKESALPFTPGEASASDARADASPLQASPGTRRPS